MEEKIIVSLTTWKARMANIPPVLDSIYKQTLLPDKVVLNLAYDEIIPLDIQNYLEKHDVEIFRTDDTKVYKKFLPTLKRYPEACVINIDDDYIYPSEMIADFMEVHKQYPNHPISGNKYIMFGMMCHCGWASLTKLEYFDEYVNEIDDELIKNSPSSDIAYTFFATKSGHPYVTTNGLYSTNMKSYNEVEAYTPLVGNRIENSYEYLVRRFGTIDRELLLKSYVHDSLIGSVLYQIESQYTSELGKNIQYMTENKVRSSRAYRLGKMLLKPLKLIKMCSKNKNR